MKSNVTIKPLPGGGLSYRYSPVSGPSNAEALHNQAENEAHAARHGLIYDAMMDEFYPRLPQRSFTQVGGARGQSKIKPSPFLKGEGLARPFSRQRTIQANLRASVEYLAFVGLTLGWTPEAVRSASPDEIHAALSEAGIDPLTFERKDPEVKAVAA